MATIKIMLIRHAEKPSKDGRISGVAEDGSQNAEELAVRGWQRAGALARFFAPLAGRFADARLATPDIIFASGVAHHSESLRPQHTLLPLGNLLGKTLNLKHSKGDESSLVNDAVAANRVVLIAWEHEAIPTIANLIIGDGATCPQTWPDDRFDVVWVFDRLSGAGPWTFQQVPQLLLANDSPNTV
jgi:broad specificity phosphatase PhoE